MGDSFNSIAKSSRASKGTEDIITSAGKKAESKSADISSEMKAKKLAKAKEQAKLKAGKLLKKGYSMVSVSGNTVTYGKDGKSISLKYGSKGLKSKTVLTPGKNGEDDKIVKTKYKNGEVVSKTMTKRHWISENESVDSNPVDLLAKESKQAANQAKRKAGILEKQFKGKADVSVNGDTVTLKHKDGKTVKIKYNAKGERAERTARLPETDSDLARVIHTKYKDGKPIDKSSKQEDDWVLPGDGGLVYDDNKTSVQNKDDEWILPGDGGLVYDDTKVKKPKKDDDWTIPGNTIIYD